MSIKGLKLSVEECEEKLHSCVEEKNGKVTLENNGNGRIRFSIEIPGQGTALLDVFNTGKGLTLHHKVGPLQDLSEAFAKAIAETCEAVTTKTHTFRGITDDLYKEFRESFEDDFSVTLQKDDDKQIIVKIASTKPDITVTWFKTNHTLMIQGRTTNVWDEVALWFAGRVATDPNAVIDMIFDSKEKFAGAKISYDESYIEGLLRAKIGNAYQNNKVLRGYEVKWLNMSQFFLQLDIELPDYYPTISASMKIIEGILKRICIRKFGHASFDGRRSFVQFEEASGTIKLRNVYKSNLSTSDAISCTENLYIFLKTKRHPLSHNDGLASPAVLPNKANAVSLFDEILTLINDVNRFERDLF